MQVKKFEAPTLQEALENIKRELGPEAIILQTKKNKSAFGLMSKGSIEITAAVSDRSLQKKQVTETRLTDNAKTTVKKMQAEKQADFFDKYTARYFKRAEKTKDRVEVGPSKDQSGRPITATRYIEIIDNDDGSMNSKDLPQRTPVKAEAKTSAKGQSKDQVRIHGSYDRNKRLMETWPEEEQVPADAISSETFAALDSRGRKGLEDEIQQLKKMIQDIQNSSHVKVSPENLSGFSLSPGLSDAFGSPAIMTAFEQLILNGVDRRVAMGLIRKVTFELGPERLKSLEKIMDSLVLEMLETLKVGSLLGDLGGEKERKERVPLSVALLGPSGVGKTTTIAKLAGEALLKRKLKVGLINFQSKKPTSFDQLATYAKILNVPFRSAASLEDMRAALSDFQGLDLILIDTPGHSHRDSEALQELQKILSPIPNLVTSLAVSVATRDTDLYETASHYSRFQPKGLVITKLDEATVYGSIYNIFIKSKLPLFCFTTGQKIPDDIEPASAERVVSLILDI